jgi:CheY-like chemotaxis protein
MIAASIAALLWSGAVAILVGRHDGSGALLLALAALPATAIVVLDDGRRTAALLVAALALCAFASATGLVPQHLPWDDLEHAVLAFAFCCWLGDRLADVPAPVWLSVAAAVGLTMTCAAAWEIVEWTADRAVGTNFSPSDADTVTDLAAGAIGSAFGAAWALAVTARRAPTLEAARISVDEVGMDLPQRLRAAPRVLVVDDSPLMLAAAVLGLRGMRGWDVATALTGTAGVELAARYRPDAILLDVVMPELDGPGTLRALREQASTHETPVVFLTADRGDLGGLVEMGAAGVIAKPFQPGGLAGQLSEVLGWS